MDVPTRRLPPGVTMNVANNCFQINILWGVQSGWKVAYPVIPEPVEVEPGSWSISVPFRPGQVPQWETMTLHEFLNMLADEYKLPHVFIANVD